ncbi:MAG: DUF892 family protein [Bradymonadaceae bacterium]
MPDRETYERYYANQMLRLYQAENRIAGLVDDLIGEVHDKELKQVLEQQKEVLDEDVETVARMYERLGVEGDSRRAEAFGQVVAEAEQSIDALGDLPPSIQDLETIVILEELQGEAKSTRQMLYLHAQQMGLDEDVMEFESMQQRKNRMDQKLTNVARTNLYGDGEAISPPRPRVR